MKAIYVCGAVFASFLVSWAIGKEFGATTTIGILGVLLILAVSETYERWITRLRVRNEAEMEQRLSSLEERVTSLSSTEKWAQLVGKKR